MFSAYWNRAWHAHLCNIGMFIRGRDFIRNRAFIGRKALNRIITIINDATNTWYIFILQTSQICTEQNQERSNWPYLFIFIYFYFYLFLFFVFITFLIFSLYLTFKH